MESINVVEMVGNMKNWGMWGILGIAAGFGALGGLAHKLTSPPEDKTSLPGYLIVGIVASLAVLFVFTPSDAVKFIALSLVAGYGGKSVLNALEARVKTALAEKETADTKDDGKKAVETGKEAISQAQKLCDINKKLEEDLINIKGQPRKAIYEGLTTLTEGLHSFAAKSPDAVMYELSQLSNKLSLLEESFTK